MPELTAREFINAFAVVGCLLAFWKGGVAERAAALVVVVNVIIGQTGHIVAPTLNNPIRLVNDGLTALVLLGITVRYGAPWMGGMMLFYAAQFAMHSFYIVTERANDYWHALINNLNFSGIIWCLIMGTTVSWRARRRRARAASPPAT